MPGTCPCPCPSAGPRALGALAVPPQRWERVLGTVVGGARLLATPLLRGSSCCWRRCEHTHQPQLLLGLPTAPTLCHPSEGSGLPWPWLAMVWLTCGHGAAGPRGFARSSHSPILSPLSLPCGFVAGIPQISGLHSLSICQALGWIPILRKRAL